MDCLPMLCKLYQLLELVDTHNAQIIANQETKLKEQMTLNIKEFHINCLDRPNRRSGGLALLIRDVKYQNIVIPETSTYLESQGVSIFWGNHKLIIFNMYHPPNQGCLPDSFLDLATANVSSIFIGDLNAKHTSWGCSVNNIRGCDFLNAADDRALIFLNDGSPTHHSFRYNTAETLDIALANADVFPFCHWSVLCNIGSDHLPIKIELKKPGIAFLQQKYFGISVKLTDQLLLNLQKKTFRHSRFFINSIKIIAGTKNSKLWSIAKSLSKDRPQVEVCNTIFTADGFPPNDDRATGNILGSHYQKMSRLTFNKANKNTERQAKLAVHKCRSLDLGQPVFLADLAEQSSMHELLLVLNALDPKKSPGPDNIHGVMITHPGPRGTQHLLDIFNKSRKSGRLPHEGKRATIIPIRKPGKLSAAKIKAGLRNSCHNTLVLNECDLQALNMRRNYCLTKYFNKLRIYGDQHRTSQYLKHWKVNQSLKRNSPFSQALAQNLSLNVEHHCLTSFINPVLGL
ncbi:RNA-directed DNA polymerase from mobile element jockey [Trichonephila clavipes]|nr:RNA-directed DNA polymerase from mobile element jockey [Trichonephila clavipes]